MLSRASLQAAIAVALTALLAASGCKRADCARAEASAPPPSGKLLLRESPAEAGVCSSTSGSLVAAGADVNGNGALDDDEILETIPVCAPPRARVIIRENPEADLSCYYGGANLSTGRDTNGNGVLEGEEIAGTLDLCMPRPPDRPPVLMRTDPISTPSPTTCPFGGTAALAGADRNGNGTLDPDEVERTEYLCSNELTADIAIHSQAELDQFALHDVLNGNLLVEADDVERISLWLDRIAGSIVVRNCPGLKSLSVGVAVGEIDGSITVEANPSLEFFTCGDDMVSSGTLAVHGDLIVRDNPALSTLDAENVYSIDGSVIVERNAALTWISLGAERFRESLVLVDNASLRTDFFSLSVSQIGGVLRFERNAAFTRLSLPKVETIGALSIESNAALTDVTFERLRAVLGDIELSENPSLRTFGDYSSDSLTWVGGSIRVENNPQLYGLDALANLGSLDGDLTVSSCPYLASLMPWLLAAHDISIHDQPLFFTVLGNTQDRWREGYVPRLERVHDLRIDRNPQLCALSMAALKSIGGTASFTDNPQLPTCAVQDLIDRLGMVGATVAGNSAVPCR